MVDANYERAAHPRGKSVRLMCCCSLLVDGSVMVTQGSGPKRSNQGHGVGSITVHAGGGEGV